MFFFFIIQIIVYNQLEKACAIFCLNKLDSFNRLMQIISLFLDNVYKSFVEYLLFNSFTIIVSFYKTSLLCCFFFKTVHQIMKKQKQTLYEIKKKYSSLKIYLNKFTYKHKRIFQSVDVNSLSLTTYTIIIDKQIKCTDCR